MNCMDADAEAGTGEKMKINRNMSAVIANKQLKRTEDKLAASMERLTSGLKINSAGDNPAGMAISNKMKAQIDGLDQAESNVTDAVSTIQIADGALNEVSSILQRMRELSVQAANGTNSPEERQSIQMEIDALREEVDRVSKDTEYNTKTLLDGSLDVRTYAENVSRIYVSDTVTSGIYNLQVTETAEKAEADLTIPQGVDGSINIGGMTMEVTSAMSADEFFEEFRNTAENAGYIAEREGDAIKLTSSNYGSLQEIRISASADVAAALGVTGMDNVVYDAEKDIYTATDNGKDAVVSIPGDPVDAGFSGTTTVHADGNRITVTDRNGFSIDFLLDEECEAGTDLEFEVTEIGTMTIQVGSNQYQTVEVRIPEVSADTLYLDTVNASSEQGAGRAIVTLDEAIEKVSSVRSRLGAYQNRMEYAEKSLAETQENVTSAYSKLLDTDMAEEMVEYTQQNVLDQAGISVLSQANDLPQQILSLLS